MRSAHLRIALWICSLKIAGEMSSSGVLGKTEGSLLVAVTVILLLNGGCGRPERVRSAVPSRTRSVEDMERFRSEAIGRIEEKAWITHVNTLDLDQDGRTDVLVCDAKANAVTWLRQGAPGVFEETVLKEGLLGPVHVEGVDIDRDGDLDLLVACMGKVFPNNDKIGSVVILENDGHESFTPHVIAENIARVTDIRAADFDGDGRLDLAVGQFGYVQGEIRWMRNTGNWQFESEILLSLPGTINVCAQDMNGDGTPDIVALVSQQYEEVYLFENHGGRFKARVLFGSTNEDFGSSGLSLSDLDRDGDADILYTNGDGFAYADPGRRPWHGLQWIENLGSGQFRYHRIADMYGAYSPIGVDLDGRGIIDIVCVSAFNDWSDPDSVSLVVFKNDGRMNFAAQVLAREPIQLLTVAAEDLDGSGRMSLVTGAFYSYPPFERMGRINLWRQNP